MMKRIKKSLALMLCFLMLLSVVPVQAFAADADTTEPPTAVLDADSTPTEGEPAPAEPAEDPTNAPTEQTEDQEDVPVFSSQTAKATASAAVEGIPAKAEDGGVAVLLSDDDVAKIGDTGYATLEAAITAAVAGDTIELLADVTLAASTIINKSITITTAEGVSATIHRGAFQPAMFSVQKATLTLSGNLTLDGAKSDGSQSYGSIVLCTSGTAATPSALVMNAGVTLQDNQHTNATYGGAITLNGAASFTMNGGTITNCGVNSVANQAKNNSAGGGAVRMTATSTTAYPTMVMNGGTISNCFAIVGGAVFLANNYATTGTASFTMNGGSITGCVAGTALDSVKGYGSAFFTFNKAKSTADDTVVYIYGGSITGCKAYQYGTLGMNSGVSSNPYNGGKYYILGGRISGNVCGYGGSWDGSPGGWYGQGVHVQGLAYDGTPLVTIGGSAVINDEIYLAKTGNLIAIRDDFTGSAKLFTAGYNLSSSDGTGTVIAKASETAAQSVADRVYVTNPKWDGSNYAYDEDGNIVPRYGLAPDPEDAGQYILDVVYSVTYTDGVEDVEIFADKNYYVTNGASTPTFTPPLRAGYVFKGWDPLVEETVTEDATYTATWDVCEHVWGDPVVDPDALTNTYTCTVCGDTKVVDVVARVESTGAYYETLQDALNAAKAIIVDADHETQTVTLLADVTESVSLAWVTTLKTAWNFNLTLDLGGHTVTGTGSSTVLKFTRTGSGAASYAMNITVQNGTITGGSATSGGGIYITGKSTDSLTVNANLTGNTATASGGAIYSSTVGLDIIINGGTISGNSAPSGGAISAPTVVVNGGVITGNTASGTATWTGRGGGICVWATTASLTVNGGQIYGNTASRYGDDIVFASTSTAATSSPSMKLVNAASMGVAGVDGWFVDGYNGAYNSEANTTARYSYDYQVTFDSYADFSSKAARGQAIALKAATDIYAVTYTDGVNGTAFEDQVLYASKGSATPAYEGTPTRDGYSFGGWDPEVAETVTAPATYTATWAPETPDWLGRNVTDEFVKFVCDSDPDHHDDVIVKWVANYTRAVSDPTWDEELNTWTVTVRLEAIDTMYLWMNYEKKVGVDHDLVPDKPVPADQDYLDVTMKWDDENVQWVHLDEKPLEFHVTCQTMPTLPNSISGYQVKMVDATGELNNWFVNVKADTYTFGEIKGSREEGFTVDVTFHFSNDDPYMTSWTANRGDGYGYDWTLTEQEYTVTLTYAGSLTGTLSSGPWQYNGLTNKGTIATVYVNKLQTVVVQAVVNGDKDTAETIYTGKASMGANVVEFLEANVTIPEKEGYSADKWYNWDWYGHKMSGEATISGWTNVYIDYVANDYTLTLDSNNGGKSSFESKTVTYDEAIGELPWGTDYQYSASSCTYILDGWVDEDGNEVTAETIYKVAGDSTIYARWVQLPGSSSTHVTNELFTIECTTNHDHKWVVNWFGSHVKLVANSVAWDAERGCWTATATFSNFSLINSTVTRNNYFGGFTHHYESGQSITIQMYYDPDATGLNSQRVETTGLWLPDGEFVTYVYCYDKPAAPSTTTVEKLDKIIWVHENGSYPDGPKGTSKYVTSRKLIAGTYTLGEMYEEDGSFYCELTITDLAPYVQAFTDKYGEGYCIDTINSYAEYKYILKYTGSTTDYKQDGTGWTVDASSYATGSEKLNGKSLWMTNKYEVVVHPNNGEEDFTVYATYGSALTVDVSRTGYTLTGWVDENGNAVDLTQPYANDYKEITAQWTANEYTVSFNANGGEELDPITVTYDSAYGKLPASALKGFTSEGWYLVNEDGDVTDTEITADTIVATASDHTLFQKRAIAAPTVTMSNSRSKTLWSFSYNGSAITLTATTTQNAGLTYSYQWYKDGEAIEGATSSTLTVDGNVSDSGVYRVVVTVTLADGSTVVTTNESATGEAEKTMTIRKLSNTLYQDFNDGSAKPYVYSSYTNLTYISVKTPTKALVREGYTFTGNWNTEPDGSGTNYRAGQTYTFVEDNGNGGIKAYLYAQWTANEYTVTLDANGGEVDPESVTVTFDAPVGELPVPALEGYTFAGWTDEDGNEVTAETVYTVAGDSALTAQWTANEYTVTLDANGGEVDPESVTVTYDAAVGELPVPTRNGYTFTGWTDEDGNAVTAETIYTVADDSTLTAQWTANDYTLALDAAGGKVDPESLAVTYDAPIGKLPTPTREGYTFARWVDAEGNAVAEGDLYKVAGDSKLTAEWKANTYTIFLDAKEGKVDSVTVEVTYGQPVGKLPMPTRSGYTFGGWVDANGRTVTADTVYDLVGNSVLTAKWTANSTTPTEKGDSPADTGDNEILLLFVLLMTVSAAAAVVLVIDKKRLVK